MSRVTLLAMGFFGFAFFPLSKTFSEPPPTPSKQERLNILSPEDYNKKALELTKLQNARIVSVEEALEMQKKKSAILVDLRGKEAFKEKHIKGAINLPPEDLTEEAAKKLIPSKDTTLIIYCQNNFGPSRMVSLTTYGYPTLYQLGYKNIYQLEELWQKRQPGKTDSRSFGGGKDTWDLVPHEGADTLTPTHE